MHRSQSSLWFGLGLRVGLRGGLRVVGFDLAICYPFVRFLLLLWLGA